MDALPQNTIPWHLIGAALQGNIDTEEEAALQQWIEANEQNRELFTQLKDAWQNDLDEYQVYRQADETAGWNDLRNKLVASAPKSRARLVKLVSIAAVFVVALGIVTWYMMRTGSRSFETGATEQKSVSLADGTLIKLSPSTSIEIPADYNLSTRTVLLKTGEAYFEVPHKEELPFIVDMGTASVKDIGTGFSIQKNNDSIGVRVVSGKVEFRDHTNKQMRLLSAGMHLQFISTVSQIVIDSSATPRQNRLRFINTALPEVINRFKEVYGKQIIIIDRDLEQKKFTGNLEGQTFESAIDVLAESLNLSFIQKNDSLYLKKR